MYCLDSYYLFLFQHPFIQAATDPKPLLDLLAEYKAEIVEEEILDIPEDKMVSQILSPMKSIHNLTLIACSQQSLKSDRREVPVEEGKIQVKILLSPVGLIEDH